MDNGFTGRGNMDEAIKAPRFTFLVMCYDAAGNFKWSEATSNLVTTGGKNDLLDKYFAGSSYTASWFIGLKGAGTIAATDTLSSHAGWSEIAPYSGNRATVSWNAAASGSKAANSVSFNINATATIAGIFVANASSGTSGILYSASDFSQTRGVVSGDTETVTLMVSV